MKGILLVNLGSPKSTSVKDVKEYLDEFLMDERVIDYRWLFRSLLVEGIILNTRPKKSAEAYKKIWWDEGSPLIVITERQRQKLQEIVDIPVAIGMRYQEPSIEEGIRELANQGVNDLILFPLYPQYAMSTTETVIAKAEEVRKAKFPQLKIKYVKPFYYRENYINALAKSLKKGLPEHFDWLQFSYHGLPQRHIFKSDATCTCDMDNCRTDGPLHFNANCYLNHCYETTRLVCEKLGIPKEKYGISFQSRLGSDPWIPPFTDNTLENLPKKGYKNIAITSPAFVADCLETLEEIALEGKESFLNAGGESYTYIPCMNDDESWIATMKELCEELL